jgi:hypothetical protein
MDGHDIELRSGEDRPQKLDLKDQLAIVLKEYESLRKQVDQGSAFMQSLVIPIAVALAGAMIGWQNKIPPELAILTVPVLLMCGLAAAQHGEAYVEHCGQMLADVEDRVFQMSGLPLLWHETKLAAKRKAAGARGWWSAVVLLSTAYLGCEVWLWSVLGERAFGGVRKEIRIVACIAAVTPVLYGFAMAARFQYTRRKWSPTRLAKHLCIEAREDAEVS